MATAGLAPYADPAVDRGQIGRCACKLGGIAYSPASVPDTPITYEDVEVVETDGLGLTCRIGNDRVFVGKYVPLDGSTIRAQGDRGRLSLPRWFVEQQGLALSSHMSDRDVDEWWAAATLRLAAAKERADGAPSDPEAQAALDRATAELAAAMAARARRNGQARR